MGNARNVSNKIWRTVVVAGAMLGAIPACGGGQKPTPVGPASTSNPTGSDVAADPKADEKKLADDKAAAEAKAAEDARLLAEKEAADAAAKAAADKEAADKAAADKAAADKAAAEQAAKKRPRGGGQKPVGRGFVLA